MNAVKPTRLVGTIRSMLHKFQGDLTGPKQVTRAQLVRYLAQELDLPEENAAALYDALDDAGVVLRDDEQFLAGWVQPADISRDGDSALADDDEPFVEADGHAATPTSTAAESPAVELLRRAVAMRASDVHLDAFEDEVEVRFRIDGRLEHYCRLSRDVGEHLRMQFKVLGNVDGSQPFSPHESRLVLPPALADLSVRLTSTPVAGGEAMALRLMRREQLLRPLDTLGFSNGELAKVSELLKLGEGLVLIAGPSGAGKTTTAYSLVHALDDGHRNIVTIEDPVEYRLPEFVQVEVDRRHERSMADGVKTLLRMDPDIMLVGEIRDADTAAAAMRAASCGKYVFSTIHSRDAASFLTALQDLGVDARSLASNLRAIISQRLVRRICRSCDRMRSPDASELGFFAAEGLESPVALAEPVGCSDCRNAGYRERIGVFEIAQNTPEMADAIRRGAAEGELREVLRAGGARSLAADGLQKVAAGVTSLEEVRAMSWVKLQAASLS